MSKISLLKNSVLVLVVQTKKEGKILSLSEEVEDTHTIEMTILDAVGPEELKLDKLIGKNPIFNDYAKATYRESIEVNVTPGVIKENWIYHLDHLIAIKEKEVK